MSYQYEKSTGEIVISGFDQGIAYSPHKGIGNLQSVNLSTENGEVMCSFSRFQQTQTKSTNTGTLTPSGATDLISSLDGATISAGIWITITASTITSVTNGNVYYVKQKSNGLIQISNYFNSTVITHGTTGTASFKIWPLLGVGSFASPVTSATEKYSDGTNFQYRYYILDSHGNVWVQDTMVSTPGITWFLPDPFVQFTNATGMAVLNGWLMIFNGNNILIKPTVNLGDSTAQGSTGVAYPGISLMSPDTSPNPHFAFVGHQGKLYYTDGNFIGSIFPDTSLLTGVANIQSYASYTTSTTTGTISALIDGSIPSTGTDNTRIPALFFPQAGFSNPSALTAGTIYYIQYSISGSTFQVYSAASGGSALDITSGATGTQYFNTFYPASAGGQATITFTPQRLNLPFFETSKSIAELGNLIVIGCTSNVLYPWNQVDPTPSDIIPLPENNVSNMITVNNMVYVFAGAKGNIYITNGSTASLVLSVPDYCAGIAGTPASYIEPYFTWGGAMYLRGRVWFSILDQTASKAGNCGGIWSFVPTQNFFIGQDTGISLRLENQASYGTYNGVSPVLLASQNQNAIGAQYWNAWYSSISSPAYGIDFTNTTTSTPAIIETDLIPTGTLLDKKTFKQIEYKLSTPLAAGESVAISYRQNSTDSYVSCGSVVVESSTSLSGYFTITFEKGQWLQLKITLTPLSSSSSSFVRLREVRVR